ncbi:MAG: GntR family transcriptional regulator [Oligosphaeraceae bacterium]|nr:GntR family transcriptional regulator [Oligosphaeraceae bacterium]
MRDASLDPGDPLPREEDIADTMKASRHVVKEDIRRLKALGLVESRKRRGTVVCRLGAFRGLRKLPLPTFFTSREKHEFMNLRVAWEPG